MTSTEQEATGTPTQLDSIADAAGPFMEPDEHLALSRERAARAIDPLEELRRVRALTELLDIYEERAVSRATADGRTQREVAEALGRPQTHIHRTLRRARISEADQRTSAREVILQYKAGAMRQGMMLGMLTGSAEGTSAEGLHDDGFAPDDWDEIRSAFMTGLLTEAEYEELRRTKAKSASRRRR